MYGAIYGSNNLNNEDYQITKIDISMPKMKVSKYELAQSDGQVVTSKYFGERIITVEGRIIATDLDDMQAKLDTLKTYTTGYENELDITMGNTNRRYTATVESFKHKTQGYYCEWTINFTCNALGTDPASTALTLGTYTTSPTSYANTILGTYYAEPSLDFTVNFTNNWFDAKYIEFKNPASNQRMIITRVWSFGDRVVINGASKVASVYPSIATVVDNCDSITGWTSGDTLSYDATNKIQGTGCLKLVMGSATASSYVRRLNGVVTDFSSSVGYVVFPVFIPTPTSGTVASVGFAMGSDATLATNYCYYSNTTQADGSAITSNAWNYFKVDLSASPTSTTGTPVMTAIKSIQITVNATATMQLNGWLVDYISTYQINATPTVLDYEGILPDLQLGSSTITVSDDMSLRSIALTGSYYKRYL